jgi:hypothetical protein
MRVFVMNNPSSLRNAKENLNPDQESLSYSHSACEDVNVSGILTMRLKTYNPEPDSSIVDSVATWFQTIFGNRPTRRNRTLAWSTKRSTITAE